MRIVAALGGNALLERGEKPDAEIQQHHVDRAAQALAPLCRQHEVLITHGNGPQVGVLALESDSDPALSHGYPLDALGAQTQGMIGYWLVQALENELPGAEFATLICQTEVSSDDPAFDHPTKFVGQVYEHARAQQLAHERGWSIALDGGMWRRVVSSPRPKAIVELPIIRYLLAEGVTVVCSGGGGIPVARDQQGRLRGIEAVIDKDRSAALIAEEIDADLLLLLTDVAAVEIGYGTPDARPIYETTTPALRTLLLPDGSMGPKVGAACDFVDRTGSPAAIGALVDAEALAHGKTGTIVRCHP